METSCDDAVMVSVRALAEEIGPRLSGSEGERAAAEWLAARLGEAGYEVEVDRFRAYSTFMAVYAPLTVLGAAAWVLAWWWPIPGALLAIAAGALLVLENRPVQLLSRLVKFRRSHNVVASRAPVGEPAQDIVVLAHIDSPVVSDIRNLRVVRALYLGMIGSCFFVAAIALAVTFGAPAWVSLFGLPFAFLLFTCAAIMVHQAFASPVVAGAGDNASGVAAMLQAARELPPLQHSRVWFVGDGGEEAGLLGALRFVETRRLARDRTWFINVDMVSAGTLRTSAQEGMLFRHRCDPDLCRIAAEELPVPSEVLRAMSTDACVPLSRGYRATTLSSTKGYWHQLNDTVENVDPAVVAQAAALIRRMIERLDRDPAGGPTP
ncbi:MAG: M28 family peptidase [Armatimonadetes bacterium]|nr:M28 family peptidase [Armatimonadota bacterium]